MGVAAVLGREDLMTRWPPDSYTSTFLTNGVNLAAATAAIGVLRDENLTERSRDLGSRVLTDVRTRLAGTPSIGEVRGRGLWVGIELIGVDGAPAADLARHVQKIARRRGVLVGRGGYEEQVIKLSPALTIEEADLQYGVNVVVDAIHEATGESS